MCSSDLRGIAAGVEIEAARGGSRDDHRQKRRKGDVFAPGGLLDALQVDPQARLLPEREIDRLSKRQDLIRRTTRALWSGRRRYDLSHVGMVDGFRQSQARLVFGTIERRRREDSLAEAVVRA